VPERVSVALAGLHAGGQEARERLSLDKMGDEVELVVDKTEPVEPHRCDGMARRHKAPCRVWLRRLVHDLGEAECCHHAGDKAQGLEDQRAGGWRLWRDGRPVRVSPRLLLCRGDGIATPKLRNDM